MGPAARGMKKERVGGRKDAAAGPGRWLAGPLESLGEDDERSDTAFRPLVGASAASAPENQRVVKIFNAREPIID